MRFVLQALVILMLAGFTAAAPARAQDGESNKTGLSIAVVDIQALLKNSKAAKGIEDQLAGIRKNFQADVDAEEKSLRAKEKAIMDQKASLKEEELKAKASEFQKDLAASQKKIQDKKAKLDKAIAEAIGKLRAEIVKVVAEIGDKQGLDIVLARTDVVIVSKSLDITSQVLSRIDADMPSVSVNVP